MTDNFAPGKWLRTLFYIHIGLLAATIASWLPIPDQGITWVKRILILATVLCLFRLSPLNPHYHKATIFRGLYIAGVLLTPYLFQSFVITLVVSIFSILAAYHTYHGHSRLIACVDADLSQKWSRFFGWALLVEVLTSIGSSILTVAATLMGFSVSSIISTVMIILTLPRAIVDVCYLIYLNRTVRLFYNTEGDIYG